ncbi:MAG: Short-chain dehydrogenase/reductase SDR [Candidatus Saganbacteria bacterium]|uniref:Short-chain dehydrogenase/reductase SDR n=1 Tax=Candidatus Saganbacteria bacterium TaxID=2575572 RepID=A0A833L2F9_UNCSA|nr:MAG: Short-chain dehydrogenase/reductase SDR [Candidatus Saganbacteria bacterium]
MKKERIIVTGSEGLIGSSLVPSLSKSYEVVKLSLRFGHDFSQESFVKEWFANNQAEYLVNCFGMNDHVKGSNTHENSLFEVSLASIEKFLLVNVVSLFSVCREFAKNKSAKAITNLSSMYGLVSPRPGLYKGREKHIGYSISKGAVIQLTRHLAAHLGPRVRVNCIAPGGIEHQQDAEFIEEYSKFTPMKRMMQKNELNGLVELLCSDKSSYMTGSVLVVDGGITIV